MTARRIAQSFGFMIFFTFCACSSVERKDDPQADPSAQPPIQIKPELFSRCAVSNGAGRVFRSTHSSRYIAEATARRECAIYSRHCVLLDCIETTNAGD